MRMWLRTSKTGSKWLESLIGSLPRLSSEDRIVEKDLYHFESAYPLTPSLAVSYEAEQGLKS